MTTLNGIPRSWDSFIQGIGARKRLISFSRIREECAQEEARIVIREKNMGANNNQSLIVHTKKNFKKKEKKDKFHHKKKEKKEKKTKRDPSNGQCYTCDENIHFARDCPMRKRRHRAHVAKEE